MAYITLAQAAAWCGGTVAEKYKDVAFLGANNDTRKLQPGQLFVALMGERDGHDFVASALEKGAAAVLCSKDCGDVPAILVEDTRIALGRIAAAHRRALGLKVVGVTGSVGKSTTKEMIACVLEGDYITAKTPANHNNDIGMPMAVLAIPQDTQLAVLEMGMNHFGEISYLTNIARPDVAVIVNIGTAHVEYLGSRQGILQAKLEILEGLSVDGRAYFNGDDDLLRTCSPGRPVTFFGRGENCSVRTTEICQAEGSLCFTVEAGECRFPVTLPLEGLHYVCDALAAVSVALDFGVSPEHIARRLGAFRNMQGRQQIYEAKGCTIIDDCYNAGPESMEAALKVLGSRKGRRIAVLGDMLELGSRTQAEHYRVGRIAAENADIVMAFGGNGFRVINGAVTGGVPENRVHMFDDHEKLIKALCRTACQGDTILFKGSRGMHLEIAVQGFLKED